MDEKIEQLISEVTNESRREDFIHHQWFAKWHLEIVDKIAQELCEYYPEADRDLVRVVAWMHDYGKILDFDNQYEMTLTEGPKLLQALGFEDEFTQKVISYIEILDSKMTTDISKAPIEVQVVSSADGCSHMVGPFMYVHWLEESHLGYEELMLHTIKKLDKDWDRKIVLPEARKSFEAHRSILMQLSGQLPEYFIV